jgi:hypothetical protein
VNNTRSELFFKSSHLSPSASLSAAVGTPPRHRRPPRGASHRRMPPCLLPSATSPMPSHLGKPLPSPCRAPPRFTTSDVPGDPAAFRPPSSCHRSCRRAWPEHGDNTPAWLHTWPRADHGPYWPQGRAGRDGPPAENGSTLCHVSFIRFKINFRFKFLDNSFKI